MASIEKGAPELALDKPMKPGNVRLRSPANGKDGRTRFRAKKSLGQHFLVETKIIHKMIACAGFNVSDRVLEIGPGQGALTIPLARSVEHVIAVEKDTHLLLSLQKRLNRAGISNVTLINHDILKWDFQEIKGLSSKRIPVIGNLPYNISSPVLEKLVKNRDLISRSVLMFQLEVAKRLTASPGSKAYGALTLLVRYYAQPRPLLEVSKDAFNPKPNVDSMVLELDFEKPYPGGTFSEDTFKKIVKDAFAHRRKTMVNSLRDVSPSWDREALLDAMKRCGIDPKKRAETLDMGAFLCLTDALSNTDCR